MMHGRCLPRIWIDVALRLLVSRELVMAVWVAGRVDDAGIVATVGEHERHVRLGQHLDLVDRPPRRDVVGDGADSEKRYVDIPERHRLPVNLEASLRQVVVEKQPCRTGTYPVLAAICPFSSPPSPYRDLMSHRKINY
jgi:hypothetical protein